MQTISSIVISFSICLWLLLHTISLSHLHFSKISTRESPSYFQGPVTSSLLHDTFSMAKAIFPRTHFFLSTSQSLYFPWDATVGPRTEPSFPRTSIPSVLPTLELWLERMVRAAASAWLPQLLFCCPFSTSRFLLLYLQKMGQIWKRFQIVIVQSFALETARWRPMGHI